MRRAAAVGHAPLAALLVTAVLGAGPVDAKVAGTTLEHLAETSPVIVVGRVSVVREIDGLRIADVEVLRVIKGLPASRVYVLAQPTWTCDISGAQPGETGLWFLTGTDRLTMLDGGPVTPERSAAARRALAGSDGASSAPAPLLAIAWSGRGRMPFHERGEGAYAELWPEILLPGRVATAPGPERASGVIRSVRVEELLEAIRAIVGGHDAPR